MVYLSKPSIAVEIIMLFLGISSRPVTILIQSVTTGAKFVEEVNIFVCLF